MLIVADLMNFRSNSDEVDHSTRKEVKTESIVLKKTMQEKLGPKCVGPKKIQRKESNINL